MTRGIRIAIGVKVVSSIILLSLTLYQNAVCHGPFRHAFSTFEKAEANYFEAYSHHNYAAMVQALHDEEQAGRDMCAALERGLFPQPCERDGGGNG